MHDGLIALNPGFPFGFGMALNVVLNGRRRQHTVMCQFDGEPTTGQIDDGIAETKAVLLDWLVARCIADAALQQEPA